MTDQWKPGDRAVVEIQSIDGDDGSFYIVEGGHIEREAAKPLPPNRSELDKYIGKTFADGVPDMVAVVKIKNRSTQRPEPRAWQGGQVYMLNDGMGLYDWPVSHTAGSDYTILHAIRLLDPEPKTLADAVLAWNDACSDMSGDADVDEAAEKMIALARQEKEASHER